MNAAEEQRVFLLLLDEIDETLADFERRCLQLEGSASQAELKIAFRAAHNIKGGSRLFGLNEFGHFVHGVEELLSTLQTRASVDVKSVDLLLKAHSVMAEWTKALRQDRKTVIDTAVLGSAVQAHAALLRDSAAAAAPASVPDPGPTPASVAANPVEVPAETAIPRVEPSVPAAEAPAPVPVTQDERPLVKGERRGTGWKSPPQKRRRGASLRISSQKIDEIMQLLGELSIHQSILWHGQLTGSLDSDVCRNAIALNQKVVKDMQSLVLSLRMQPVESLFQRVERAARDLGGELRKKIQVILVGSEVLLDKTVIELMVDPMMHLIRNAIDHGIEDEQDRVKSGKPVPARVKIEASQDAGQVVISVTDDGRGIDPEIVRGKAIEKGLIQPTANLSDEEAIQLIFMAGFSTREQVTEISGRGVGMDVVQQAIQQIGGGIETRSKVGAGTMFQISLPTSLEVIDGLVVRACGSVYIVPMQDVIEIVDLSAFRLERVGQDGWAIRLREMVVPVEDLSDYLGEDPGEGAKVRGGEGGRDVALVVRLQSRGRLALRIDQVIAQQQIVVRPLSDKLATVPAFTGATILGNGEPGLILSVSYIGDCYLGWIARARRTA